MITSVAAGLSVPPPDVVLGTSPQLFCGWAGALVSVVRRRPFVLEVRDLWPESIRAVGALKNRPLLGLLKGLERGLYHCADHIVTLGEGYRDQLRQRGVPLAKLSIVTNGVDAGFFQPRPTDAEMRRRYGLEGKLVCCYAGTVGMACGLEVVVRAASRLKVTGVSEVTFLVVGAGAGLDRLKTAVAGLGLHNVIFAGLQPKERVAEFLSAADVCLVHLIRQPLFATVMPSKTFEALAMGRPVILGVEGHAAEFLRTAGGGLCIEPENEDELVSALERLRRDPVLGRSLGASGRRYVLENFDWEKLAAKYLGILHLVNHRFGRRS